MKDHMIAVRSEDGVPHSVIFLTLDINQQDSVWTGTCFELGTSTYADTLEDLRSELNEAILLQLNEVERLGFTEGYLKENAVIELHLPLKTHDTGTERWGLVGAGMH